MNGPPLGRRCRISRMALLGALAYFVAPFDVLPAVILIVGFTDDAAVLATVFKMVWDSIQPEHRDVAREALARLTGES